MAINIQRIFPILLLGTEIFWSEGWFTWQMKRVPLWIMEILELLWNFKSNFFSSYGVFNTYMLLRGNAYHISCQNKIWNQSMELNWPVLIRCVNWPLLWLTKWIRPGNTKGGYHCTIDLLFVWFGLVSFANKNNKKCKLSCSWFQTCQTGGQRHSDTSPFSIPWLDWSYLLQKLPIWMLCLSNTFIIAVTNDHPW